MVQSKNTITYRGLHMINFKLIHHIGKWRTIFLNLISYSILHLGKKSQYSPFKLYFDKATRNLPRLIPGVLNQTILYCCTRDWNWLIVWLINYFIKHDIRVSWPFLTFNCVIISNNKLVKNINVYYKLYIQY